jgi:hypothetical protein
MLPTNWEVERSALNRKILSGDRVFDTRRKFSKFTGGAGRSRKILLSEKRRDNEGRNYHCLVYI